MSTFEAAYPTVLKILFIVSIRIKDALLASTNLTFCGSSMVSSDTVHTTHSPKLFTTVFPRLLKQKALRI